MAFSTAFATAAGEGTVETDPMPFAPRGFVVELVSMVSSVRGGISIDRGIA
tara:strand:+ start:298 stop:450 length:153 start_codon:yes stop_codon:yes gene_type:complete